MDNDFFGGRTEVRLEPVAAGTEVSTANTVAGKNLVLRSMLYLGRESIRDQAEATYGKLKALCESRG